ncbi:hypothetical protein [Pontibacter qinzhouensis]|uniref:hypothetical protein n=1 Tax=Pontibacter qinzhouensis TaxID=2603253 RepID=UPI0016501966|nr:hypothetical protein [Pontibacter qinzhouensis]
MSFLKYITQPANLIVLGAIIAAIITGFAVPDADPFAYAALVVLAIFLIGSYVSSRNK